MSVVRFPLSGAVNFAPWLGQLTINMGQSSNDNVEKAVLDQVASYGKQLGRIGDALIVLLNHTVLEGLSAAEGDAIADLKAMLYEIARVKEAQGLKTVLRPSL